MGYAPPKKKPSGEDEEPYEEPVELETRKRTVGKAGWGAEVQHQHDAISISALHSLLKRQGTYADTTAVENSQHMANLRVHSSKERSESDQFELVKLFAEGLSYQTDFWCQTLSK